MPSRALVQLKAISPWLPDLAISIAVWGSYLLLSRTPYFPFNDDWAYISSVEKTLRAGALRLSQGGAPSAYFQVLWGWAFARFFGYSFQVLVLSTWTMIWLGLLAFYRSTKSLAACLALFFNPLFFHLSYSFMTDAFALALMLLSGEAFVRGLRDERRERWLLAGSALAAAAYLVRQTGACMSFGVAIWLVAQGERRLGRYVAVLGLVAAAVAAHLLWISQRGPTFGLVYAARSTLWSLHPGPAAGGALLDRLAGASLYLGMALCPWLFVPGRIRRSSVAALGGLALLWLVVWLTHRVPATGNIIGRYGLGGCPLMTSCDFRATGPLGNPWFWKTATTLFLVSIFVTAWRLDLTRKILRDPRSAYVLGFGLAFLASLAAGSYYDRYYLALLPPALYAASQAWKPRWWTMTPAIASLAAWSIFGTWDLVACNQARWMAGRMLMKSVPPSQIMNGLDFESYYTFDERLDELLRTRRLKTLDWSDVWHTSYTTFVSFAPHSTNPRMEQVGEVSYWTPLSLRTEHLYLWRLKQ